MINFTPLRRDLEMRKNANRQIIDRSIRVLKRTAEYENATKEKKIRLMQKIQREYRDKTMSVIHICSNLCSHRVLMSIG